MPLQASERPMTQQGMGGLKTASSNRGRQVMDKTFFLSKLRQKRAELEAVNAQMQVRAPRLTVKQGWAMGSTCARHCPVRSSGLVQQMQCTMPVAILHFRLDGHAQLRLPECFDGLPTDVLVIMAYIARLATGVHMQNASLPAG